MSGWVLRTRRIRLAVTQSGGHTKDVSKYLLAGQISELDRLQLQARVWEPAGRRLLEALGDGEGLRVVDVGCGCLGWLRLLSRWVGPKGEVVGSDVSDTLLQAGQDFIEAEGLSNVRLVRDDLFASELPQHAFDLVHARFQLAPLGRPNDQLAAFRRLAAPAGRIVLEDPDSASWHCNPPAPGFDRLVELILEAFRVAGGDFDAGRIEADLFRARSLEPSVRAEVIALPPSHPYLQLPLQFSSSLEPHLAALISQAELDRLRGEARAELDSPHRWGTTFTLVQTWATLPERPNGSEREPAFDEA